MLRRWTLSSLGAIGLLALVSALYAGTGVRHGRQKLVKSSQCCGQRDARDLGGIAGLVLDVDGRPVSGVRVAVADTAFTPTGPLPTSVTDKQGKFLVKNLPAGAYNLYTEKEEDGYPFSMYAFTNVNPNYTPTATVTEGQITSDVVIHLGPKAAKLIVRVVDSTTGRRINNAQLMLRRVDNPAYRFLAKIDKHQTQEALEILVPPVPFTIEVSSPDYETWVYSKDGHNKRADSLKVNRGEARKFEIRLRPKKQP